MAGYVASVLPAIHLQRHDDGSWRTLMVRVGADAIDYRWDVAPLDLCLPDPRHAEVARRAVAGLDEATLVYPARYLDVARDLAPVLAPGGVFLLYGPFNENGRYTAPSNARFDAWLKAQDPGMGVRDRDWLDELARAAGMRLREAVPMPADNQTLCWVKS